jgi:hypothetical protein
MLKPFEMNLGKEDIREAGRVAVWSSMLDTTMEVSIWLLLDLPKPEARQLTHTMQADRKRQWLKILLKSKRLSVVQRTSLEKIVSEIGAVIGDRNVVIHGLWHIGPDGKPWAAKYSDKGAITFHKRMDQKSIHPIAEQVKALAIRLAEWNEALEPGAMSSSFPKIPSQPKKEPRS